VPPQTYESFVADLKDVVNPRTAAATSPATTRTDRRNLGVHSKDDHYSKEDAIAWAAKVLKELHRPASPADKPLLALFGEWTPTSRSPDRRSAIRRSALAVP